MINLEKLKLEVSEAVDIVSKWWIDKFDKPIFDNGSNDLAPFLAKMLSTTKPLLSEQDKIKLSGSFKTTILQFLEDSILIYPNSNSLDFNIIAFYVDYNPCSNLMSVIQDSGINPKDISFSWKTGLRFYFENNILYISTKEGYANPFKIIYSKEISIGVK